MAFPVLALALAAFLVAPYSEVNQVLAEAEALPGFSVESWSAENSSGNAVTAFLNDTVNDARPGRWELIPVFAFSTEFLFSAPLLFFVFSLLFGSACLLMQRSAYEFFRGFAFIFVVSILAYLLANQTEFRSMGLG